MSDVPPPYTEKSPLQPGQQDANITAGGYNPPTAYYSHPPQNADPYPGPPPPVGNSQPTVVLTSNVTPGILIFGEAPQTIECPHCHATVTTAIRYVNGNLTWIASGIICLVGCWFGCCLIPLCVNACKDVIHTCPNCGVMVGRYSHVK